jgi:hypothetical protein
VARPLHFEDSVLRSGTTGQPSDIRELNQLISVNGLLGVGRLFFDFVFTNLGRQVFALVLRVRMLFKGWFVIWG